MRLGGERIATLTYSEQKACKQGTNSNLKEIETRFLHALFQYGTVLSYSRAHYDFEFEKKKNETLHATSMFWF